MYLLSMTDFNLQFFLYVTGKHDNGKEVSCEAFIVIEYLLNILLELFYCFC